MVPEDLPFEKPVEEPEVPEAAAHQFEGLGFSVSPGVWVDVLSAQPRFQLSRHAMFGCCWP